MANHRVAALLIASLLVAVAVADARLTKPRHARVTLHYDAHGREYSRAQRKSPAAYFVSDAAKVPALTCSKAHAVKVGETCFSIAEAAGLTQDQFLGFNPNINCEKVFIGQWVCIAATSA
ncbi:hypothetical protein HU200_007621 [Digitaria exilis]|uniref:LysM domain-containing protein n=1 Tax=Digitaria exilis TaxID=1010633 RepID=A0A835KPG7_9POAL|nr:hypothetical protein HU200_007621 [Digitaria exilis]